MTLARQHRKIHQHVREVLDEMSQQSREGRDSDQTIENDAPLSKQYQGSSHELALVNQHIANLKANRELRDNYAKRAYRLAWISLLMWWIVILIQGAGRAFGNVEVWSQPVIIAITTGVTVNVLTAFLGVIRGLFGKDG